MIQLFRMPSFERYGAASRDDVGVASRPVDAIVEQLLRAVPKEGSARRGDPFGKVGDTTDVWR
jgi:hypothetical protein